MRPVVRLKTDRLIIRPFREHDLDEFRKLLDIPEAPGWQREKGRAADFLHEIFYSLLPGVRGKGYAKEAAKAVTEWALGTYHIPYIIATVEVDTIASQKVVESCGYTFIDQRALMVHILGERRVFRYYRRYASI